MQKKLLLLFMAVNCAMVQASESDVNGVDNAVEINKYNGYSAQLDPRYNQALVDSLSNNIEAINELFAFIKKENIQEEADKKHEQCDCYHLFGDPVNSATGRKFQEFKKDCIEKNKINEAFKVKFIDYKNRVEQDVIDLTVQELEEKNYTVMGNYYKHLVRCGKDEVCLRRGGAPWAELVSADYLEVFCSAVYDPAIALVNAEGIPLTQEQIIAIAKKNPKTIALVASLANGKKEVEKKLDEILNPKKEDDISILDELKLEKGEEA